MFLQKIIFNAIFFINLYYLNEMTITWQSFYK